MSKTAEEAGMLQIVIPMAGNGSRFLRAGYDVAKPLISVHGFPMIQVVVNNLRPLREHRFIFVAQKSHLRRYELEGLLRKTAAHCEIVGIEGVTAGAACTVLLARDHITNDEPLMIANCDQWINYSIDDYLSAFDTARWSGFIMTMRSSSPKWSYVRRNRAGKIVGVVEKQVVSDEATVGIYNFARGRDFVQAAESMIAEEDRSQGEFYVAPVYTHLIRAGGTVESLSIGTDRDGMYGLGTPEDLQWFARQSRFQRRLLAENGFSEQAA
jgi:dTDP-glucose pyrophosphorylase